jgi:hypothetical protein
VDPTKWTEAYDKALPEDILKLCGMSECGLCKVPLNGPAVAKSHYEGKNHERKVQLALADLYSDPDMAPKRIKTDDNAVGVVVAAPKKMRAAPAPAAAPATDDDVATDSDFYCEICNLPCTSKIVFDSHMAGKNHASRYRLDSKTEFE